MTLLPEPTVALRYIFFREDGRAFGIAEEPTPEDFDHARVGLHVIVRLLDLHTFGRSGNWSPMPIGTLTAPGPDAHSPPYHVPARFAE